MDLPKPRGELTPLTRLEPPPRPVFADEDVAGPGRTPINLDARLRRQEQLMRAVLASLNGATIECNPDDSTVVLTLPNLPASG